MSNRLKDLRRQRGLTQPALAKLANTSKAQISKLELGERRLTLEWVSRLARALGVDQAEFLAPRETVPIRGFVGAGGAAYFNTEEEGDLGEAPAPPDSEPSTVAVVVRGDSMRGVAEDQWLLYYDEREDGVPPSHIGKLCIAWLADGRILVKRIFRGSDDGLYHLVSTSADLIEDQIVDYSARITFIAPR